LGKKERQRETEIRTRKHRQKRTFFKGTGNYSAGGKKDEMKIQSSVSYRGSLGISVLVARTMEHLRQSFTIFSILPCHCFSFHTVEAKRFLCC
jgi:hypothetical protein